MTVPFRLNKQDIADIRTVAEWYEQKFPMFGRRFADEVGRVLALLAIFPNGYPLRHRNVRRVLLKHFLFQILYEVLQDEFVVLAVLDLRQDPQRVTARTDGIEGAPA